MNPKADARARLTQGPRPGEVYVHYKGGHYTVVLRSFMEDTLAQLVTYASNQYPGAYTTRTLVDWQASVYWGGREVPRFARVVD